MLRLSLQICGCKVKQILVNSFKKVNTEVAFVEHLLGQHSLFSTMKASSPEVKFKIKVSPDISYPNIAEPCGESLKPNGLGLI